MKFNSEYKINPKDFPDPSFDIDNEDQMQVAILGGGCFWCVEQIFKKIYGVNKVVSGYSGGDSVSANYEAVCSGKTGHIEVVRIEFDSHKVTFGTILKVFLSVAHDPTQVDRQGADIGTQYSSVVFCIDNEQYKVTNEYINLLNNIPVYQNPIVTKIINLNSFYEAETYHQNYAERNPNQPYILGVSKPKLQKFIEEFSYLMKKNT